MIGEKIKRLRIEQNLTQEECAEKLGISRQTLSAWENGRILPDIRGIIAICDLFHVRLDFMIREDEATINQVAEKEDEEKSRKLLIRRISLFTYLAVWAFVVAVYWIAGVAEDNIYSLVVYDVVLGALTAVISFLVGYDQEWGRTKWFLSLFFGGMFFLAGFITVDIGDYLINGDMHLQDIVFVIPGIMLSLAGISTGEISAVIRGRAARKRTKS